LPKVAEAPNSLRKKAWGWLGTGGGNFQTKKKTNQGSQAKKVGTGTNLRLLAEKSGPNVRERVDLERVRLKLGSP